jgi:hypothetical protein
VDSNNGAVQPNLNTTSTLEPPSLLGVTRRSTRPVSVRTKYLDRIIWFFSVLCRRTGVEGLQQTRLNQICVPAKVAEEVNAGSQGGLMAHKGLKARPVSMTNAAIRIGVKVMPWIPPWLKRLLAGGRRVIIDGNTLDATLQLMLAAQRLTGTGGLGAADDVGVARALMRNSHVAMGTDPPTSRSPAPTALCGRGTINRPSRRLPRCSSFSTAVALSWATSNPMTVCVE